MDCRVEAAGRVGIVRVGRYALKSERIRKSSIVSISGRAMPRAEGEGKTCESEAFLAWAINSSSNRARGNLRNFGTSLYAVSLRHVHRGEAAAIEAATRLSKVRTVSVCMAARPIGVCVCWRAPRASLERGINMPRLRCGPGGAELRELRMHGVHRGLEAQQPISKVVAWRRRSMVTLQPVMAGCELKHHTVE